MKKKTSIAVGKLSKPDRSPDEGVQTSEPRPLPAGRHEQVPVGKIRPDPDQPRKNFPEASLDEMAASIHQQGIIQPLILELMPAKWTIREPDLEDRDIWWLIDTATGEKGNGYLAEKVARERAGEENLTPYYKILAGERRWRGATRTTYKDGDGKRVNWDGLSSVPAMVHEGLDDRQRKTIQIIENLQRENLSALEEAEAYRKEIDKRRVTDPTFSAEKLAGELGMKRATMYGRLVLTRLHAPVREALVSGKISTSVAAEIAKVPTPKLQEKLLKEVTNESNWRYPYSVRDVQDEIDRGYVRQLAQAVFDGNATIHWQKAFPEGVKSTVKDEEGLVCACKVCPFRTGNMVDQFPDLASRPNVCTSPDCFDEKTRVHWYQTAETQKLTILTPKEFEKEKGKYLAGDDYAKVKGNWGLVFEAAMGKKAPDAVLVIDGAKVKKFYPKAEAVAAVKKNGHKFDADDERVLTPEQKAKLKEKEEKEEAAQDQRAAATVAIMRVACDKIEAMKWTAAVELAFWQMLYGWFEYGGPMEAWDMVADRRGLKGPSLEKVAAQLKLPQLRSVMIETMAADYDGRYSDADGYTGKFKQVCKFASVDIKAEEKKFHEAAQKEMTLTAKKAPEQGKLLEVKKNKKKSGGAN